MNDQLKKGSKVEWKTPQGKTSGKVEKKLTAATQVKGHKVAASPEDPQYLVVSDKSGKRAAHKPKALKPSTKS